MPKSLEAKGAVIDGEIAKLRGSLAAGAVIDDRLAKAMAWERSFFEKQWAASGSRVDFETYMAQIEADRETIRRRAELDAADDGEPISDARFTAQFRVVR